MLLCRYWEALTDAGKAEGEGGGFWRVLSTYGYTMQLWREAVIVVTTEEMLGDEKFCEGIQSCREFYKSREEAAVFYGWVQAGASSTSPRLQKCPDLKLVKVHRMQFLLIV